MKKKTIEFKQLPVAYKILGERSPDRPVLMLVHGFPEEGSIFQYQYEHLQSSYALVIPDLPGSGESAFNESLTSVDDFGELLAAILDAEGVAKCVLAGHSMGGYIALAFAHKYPDRLTGLGLLHSTAYPDPLEKKENRLRAISFMQRRGGSAFIKTMIPDLFGTNFRENHPKVIDDLIAAGENFETKALQQYYQIMHDRPDRTQVLQQIKIPVLFIMGEDDKAVPKADMLTQATYPDITQVLMLPGVAHMGFLEARKKVNAALNQFLGLVQK